MNATVAQILAIAVIVVCFIIVVWVDILEGQDD